MTRHARDEPIPKKNNHAANTVIMFCHVTQLFTLSEVSFTSIDYQESELYQCRILSKFMALTFLVVLQV